MSKAFGNLFIVAAPSGAGKTTLVRALVGTLLALEISVSYTTRLPRPNDIEGNDYFFVDTPSFEAMLQQQVFLEHAVIYGHYYGTSRDWVLNKLQQGIDVILEIDWRGAEQVRKKIPESISIFILPPSLTILHERLCQRKQDSDDVISRRMLAAQEEISHYLDFDYLVVNENFNNALHDLQHIIHAERLSCARQNVVLASCLEQLLTK